MFLLGLGSGRHSLAVICFNNSEGCEINSISVSAVNVVRGCAMHAFYRFFLPC